MAHNIYDEYGRKIGEVRGEGEEPGGGIGDFLIVVAGLGCIIGGFLAIVPWLAPFLGEPVLLVVEIPVLIATVIASVKIFSSTEVSAWGTFWRILLVDAAIGAVVVIVAGSMEGDGVLMCLWIAALPAAIVALIARKKSK